MQSLQCLLQSPPAAPSPGQGPGCQGSTWAPQASPGGLSLWGLSPAPRRRRGHGLQANAPSRHRWVRGEHYRYKFSQPGGGHAADGKWWIRRRLGAYFPPLSLQDLKGYFKAREWPYTELE